MPGGESVLVLEDNLSIRSFVRMVLEERGFRVIEAATGWKALQLAEASPPDVLLLDWQLPDITGLDVLRALRAGRLVAPAILMTAYGSEELAMVALHLGVRDYLHKPFESDDLLQAVERALSELRLQREHAALTEQLKQSNRRLEQSLQRAAKAKTCLLKLARLVDELGHGLPADYEARIEQSRRFIQEIAEALEGPRAQQGKPEERP